MAVPSLTALSEVICVKHLALRTLFAQDKCWVRVICCTRGWILQVREKFVKRRKLKKKKKKKKGTAFH